MKKTFKGLLIVVMAMFVLSFAVALPVCALDIDDLTGANEGVDIQGTTGLGEADPRDIAANLITVILGFLGILAVIIILIGGFKWMTAAGNEDQVAEARKIIVAGIIGLVIILAAWGIATFVLSRLLTATGA